MSEYTQFWEVPNMTEAWLKIVTDTKETKSETNMDASIILDGIPAGGAALELGAGVGRLMKVVSSRFDKVVGVDMSESMVAFSREYLKDFPNCQVLKGDGYKLPVKDAEFDFVYSYICFQHMPDLQCVRSNIQEVYRVLKPGGICRVQTIKGYPCNRPNANGPWIFGGMYGQYFETEEGVRAEFEAVGLTTTVTTGLKHPLALWATGTKP